MDRLPPTKLSPVESVKWALFRMLEMLSYLRLNADSATTNDLPITASQRALWVYASTVGEVNAIKPFLNSISEQLASLKLVLITDHEHYRASYLEQYPDAVVYFTRGHSADARQLAKQFPPAMLVVAEIPCLLSDAPCRLSYSFMRTAKRNGASICLVNGWLYHYTPACRMDAIEMSLFQRDYVSLFDVACVQTDAVRQSLILAGASGERVVATGNIKFDAMRRVGWSPAQARSPQLLGALLGSSRPTVVAGCVTSYDDQERLLDAFVQLRSKCPEALLVLAPRHPEYQERMVKLEAMLKDKRLQTCFRSRIGDVPVGRDVHCLVLDTIGELRDFYAASWVAYVGRNHNILEPLAFDKPVVVSSGWESTYPSYPVYKSMLEAGAVLQIDDAKELGEVWLSMIKDPVLLDQRGKGVKQAIDSAKGASERCMAAIMPLVMNVSSVS